MVSSLAMMVARNVSVPILDPRLKNHVAFRVMDSQPDEPVESDPLVGEGNAAPQEPSVTEPEPN